jgi:hypothetical protein
MNGGWIIGGGVRHGVERNSGSGSGPVLDDNLLVPKLRQTIGDNARRQVSSATRRKTDGTFASENIAVGGRLDQRRYSFPN